MPIEHGTRAAIAASLAREHLLRTGTLRIRVTGASMLPALRPGDELEFQACAASEVPSGAVALYRRGERLVVHRVVNREGESLVTRGDALAQPDPPVAADEVMGQLVVVKRYGRQRHILPPANQRVASWLLRRSDLLTRAFLRWHRLACARATA